MLGLQTQVPHVLPASPPWMQCAYSYYFLCYSQTAQSFHFSNMNSGDLLLARVISDLKVFQNFRTFWRNRSPWAPSISTHFFRILGK